MQRQATGLWLWRRRGRRARGGRRAPVALGGALMLAVVLTGCPATDAGPDDTAESAVVTLLDACAHQEPAAVQQVLTPPERSRLVMAGSVVDGCERVLGLSIDDEVLAPDIFSETTVEGVVTDGGYATVTIRSPAGETSELELESSGDTWLVANPPLG